MRRITRLFLVILALSTVTLAAAPQKGGGLAPSKASGADYEFYCYDNPGLIIPCQTPDACACRDACGIVCGGTCDWDSSCPNAN
jgi:hypothetical protein